MSKRIISPFIIFRPLIYRALISLKLLRKLSIALIVEEEGLISLGFKSYSKLELKLR